MAAVAHFVELLIRFQLKDSIDQGGSKTRIGYACIYAVYSGGENVQSLLLYCHETIVRYKYIASVQLQSITRDAFHSYYHKVTYAESVPCSICTCGINQFMLLCLTVYYLISCDPPTLAAAG